MAGTRQARIQDAQAISRIEVETWQTTYAGMLSDDVLIGMSYTRHADSWEREIKRHPGNVWVWEDADRNLLGFGHCGPQRDRALVYDGEIYMLYVLPDAQGIGIGRGLLVALFVNLAGRGYRSALVWVVRANPARFFYERVGGQLVLQRRIPVGGHPVEALGYAWSDLAAAIGGQGRA